MRVKRGTKTRRRHKRIQDRAEGFFGLSKNSVRQTTQRVHRAWRYEFRDRKVKKREFRNLWITRIRSAALQHGLSYSKFMHGLKLANVEVNRKVLAHLGATEPVAFAQIVDVAKGALAA
jgi:large subunit ribosomal protein L20